MRYRRNPNPLRNNHYKTSDIGNVLGLYFLILVGFFYAFGVIIPGLAHLSGN